MDKPQLKAVNLDANLLGQFWTSAADVFIEIVKSQDPQVRQSIDRSISSGGDVEITAHNQAGRITVTLIEESGRRYVIFDDMVSLTEGEGPTEIPEGRQYGPRTVQRHHALRRGS
jgi:hypothetical protein